jgi:hypothetical protein
MNVFLEQAQNFENREPFAKVAFSFKIKACEKFYRRYILNIPRIKF